jgi:hypothetical protein
LFAAWDQRFRAASQLSRPPGLTGAGFSFSFAGIPLRVPEFHFSLQNAEADKWRTAVNVFL